MPNVSDPTFGILSAVGAVVNKTTGAGTVTAIVTCVPLESDTSTLAVPPLVFGNALIVNEVADTPDTTVVVAVAVTSAGLLLSALKLGVVEYGAPPVIA